MIKRANSLILILLAISTLGLGSLLGENQEESTLGWQKYDVALEQAKKEDRHILVNFTTKWCGYCRKMDATTYSDSQIVHTLSEHYSLAEVDGDSYNIVKLADGDITEKGLTRQYGVRGYPTTWLLEPDGTKIGPVRGYVDASSMQYILDWVYTNSNDKMTFKEFVEQEKLKQGSIR